MAELDRILVDYYDDFCIFADEIRHNISAKNKK